MHKRLNQQIDGTHLKAAIYESNVHAREVKTSLNLSDGALHVGSCQRLGETGEGQRHNKQLENTRGNISHQNRPILQTTACYDKKTIM